MLSFWAGGISSFPPCAREYRLLRRLPARRAWRSYKFGGFCFFFGVSKVGLPLMGDTAVHTAV